MRSKMLLLGLVLATTACGEPAGVVVTSDDVEVRLDEAGLIVRNNRATTIYTFAIDREASTVTDWAPCIDPGRCGGIKAGERVRVPADRISGWVGSQEIVLYWWHLVPKTGGGYEVDSLRQISVEPD